MGYRDKPAVWPVERLAYVPHVCVRHALLHGNDSSSLCLLGQLSAYKVFVGNHFPTKKPKPAENTSHESTKTELKPVNCKSTGKVLEITPRGRYIYKQKCDAMAHAGGHKLLM